MLPKTKKKKKQKTKKKSLKMENVLLFCFKIRKNVRAYGVGEATTKI